MRNKGLCSWPVKAGVSTGTQAHRRTLLSSDRNLSDFVSDTGAQLPMIKASCGTTSRLRVEAGGFLRTMLRILVQFVLGRLCLSVL